MQIRNLEVNILYAICRPSNGDAEQGSIRSRELFDAFSDLPQGEILSVVHTMIDHGLIVSDPWMASLTITETGIQRLRASLPCRIHKFDHCRCGRAL